MSSRGFVPCVTVHKSSLSLLTQRLAEVSLLLPTYLKSCAKTVEDPGAVMFNDRLTGAQCRRLVRQLASTAFPFQCAHGRFVRMLRVGPMIFLIISVFEGHRSFHLRPFAL